MDPGTALSVVSLVLQVSNGLYKYYQVWRDCEKDVKDLRTQLLWLSVAADSIRATLSRPGLRWEDSGPVVAALNKCSDAAHELEQSLDKVLKTEPAPLTALQKLMAKGLDEGRKALYPFRKPTVQSMAANVGNCRDACRDALQVLHLNNDITTTEKLDVLDDRIADGFIDLTSLLENLQVASTTQGNNIVRQIISHSDQNLAATQVAQEALEQRHDRTETMLLTAQEEKKATAIIESLAYPEMESRRQMIEPAHSSTLEWVFDKDDKRDCELARWLEVGRDIYWITGKPGSGKSTLMKFLAEHEKAEALLETWSGAQPCTIISHYLWVAGARLQNSFEGLWRGLLHQLLTLRPELVPKACARQWRSGSRQWSVKDLLNCLVTALSSWTGHVCILIDGLDEFQPESEHAALLQALKRLYELPHVKMIISSRPWPAFARSLRSCQSSTMESFNRADILAYIRGVVEESATSEISNLIHWECTEGGANCKSGGMEGEYHVCGHNEETRNANHLARALIDKADGVFLWIHMVMDRIRERLLSQRPIAELLRVVDDLPGDLETFFREMIYARVHETWRGNETLMAVALVLRLQTDRFQSHAIDLCMLSKGVSEVDSSIHNPNFAFDTPCAILSELDYAAKLVDVAFFMDSCCRDILRRTDVPLIYAENKSFVSLDFMHRTMYDFWQTPEMQDLLRSRTPDHFWVPEFPASVVVARARSCRLVDIKSHLDEAQERFQSRLQWADASTRPHRLAALLENTGDFLLSSLEVAGEIENNKYGVRASFVGLCCQFSREGLLALTTRILSSRPYWLCGKRPGSYWAEPFAYALICEEDSSAFVGLVLAHGMNPNGTFSLQASSWRNGRRMVTTSWALYIVYLELCAWSASKCRRSRAGNITDQEVASGCARVGHPEFKVCNHGYRLPSFCLEHIRDMIKNGADLDATVFLSESKRPVSSEDGLLFWEHTEYTGVETTVRRVLESLLPLQEDTSWSRLLKTYSRTEKQQEIQRARLDIIRHWPEDYLSANDKYLLGLPLWRPEHGYGGLVDLLFSDGINTPKGRWDLDWEKPSPDPTVPESPPKHRRRHSTKSLKPEEIAVVMRRWEEERKGSLSQDCIAV